MSENWIANFKQWLNVVRKACPATGGPGGVYCFSVGRNCSYNDCPRRSLEEVHMKPPDPNLELELEEMRLTINTLTEKLKEAGIEIVEGEVKTENATATIAISSEPA